MKTRAVAIAFTLGLILITTESEIPVISAMPVEDAALSSQDNSAGQTIPAPERQPISLAGYSACGS